jgi:enoyl-CoA hydratase
MSTKYENLLYEEDNNIGILTLNREKKLNALDETVLTELKSFLEDMLSKEEIGVRALIFTGAGEKSFIAGADIAAMSDMGVKEGEDFASLGQQVTLLFEALPIPVIAAVNGYALGGGCEMALACDFIYATENAVFGLPEVSLGLIPGFGGTQRLENIIGRNQAREIIYTGRNVKAAEALEIGIANRVFKTKAELIEGAKKSISMMMEKSPYAIKIAKKVMNRGNDLTLEEGLQIEREKFGAIFSSFDMKEGTKAFVEKRKPAFQGK